MAKVIQAELYADSNRGVYIPQYWAQSADLNQWENWNEEQISILKSGPEHESYWETWEEILDNVCTNGGGKLHQYGELWVIYPDAAIEAVNEYCESELEYETTNIDAGNNYSHMVAESWCNDQLSRMLDQCKDIDFMGLDSDQVANIAIENFRMMHGTIYGITGVDDKDFVILDSYHVQEIEIELEPLGIDGVTMDVIRESCEPYIAGTDRAYLTTNAVWYAAIKKTKLQKLIAESVAE